MNIARTREHTTDRVQMSRLKPTRLVPALIDDAREGLLKSPRALPPRYFFDAQGVRLLEDLRAAPEFYLARCEAALLSRHAVDIVRAIRPVQIIEFAAGLARSSRALLDACQQLSLPTRYWPIDHSPEALQLTVQGLVEAYPSLAIHAIEGECLGGLRNLSATAAGARLFAMLSSVIGHFSPSQTQRFLIDVRERMQAGDALLLGMDRVKDPEVLNAAYNDAGGFAAAFNRHLLRVLNRELAADFDPQGFRHIASYNPALRQMELYLTARGDQAVQINALQQLIHIGAGESIRTAVCRKYTVKGLQSVLNTAGFAVEQHYQDQAGDYSLVLARPRHPRPPPKR